ncbi:MAG: hypothetical protein K0Q94_2036 [Paenibacillus sp.]|nr:hypothetical protein [Paenibacillus sp.]
MSNVRWMVRLLAPFRVTYGLVLVLMLVETAAGLAGTGIQKLIIDDVFTAGEYGRLPYILILYILAALLDSALFTIVKTMLLRLKAKVRQKLIADFMNRMHVTPIAAYRSVPKTHRLQLLTQDVETVSATFGQRFPEGIQTLVKTVALLTIVGLASPSALLIVLAISPIYILLGKSFAAKLKMASKAKSERRADIMGRLEEGITHTREILAFHRQDREYKELNNRYQRYMDKSKEEGVITNKHAVYAGAIKWGFNLIVLAFLGYQVLNQAVTIGTFVVVYQFAAQLIDSISGSYHFLIGISSSFASVERYREGAGSESIRAGTIRFEEPIRSIRFDAVQFAYGELLTPALHNLNLDIPVGKKIAFVGESGSGKSTIAQLLVRLIEPAGGTITVNGIPLETVRRDDWASKVSLVFQETYMYPDTIRFNLAFGQNVTDDDIREACAAAQFSETAEALPDGYDTWIGERGAALSGGQKQRIAIARALLADPELLIMDESTSALDSETERLVLRSIEERRSGRTTIFIAHRLSTIASADLIYVVEHGTVTEQGTYAKLMESGPVFRRLVQAMRPDAS